MYLTAKQVGGNFFVYNDEDGSLEFVRKAVIQEAKQLGIAVSEYNMHPILRSECRWEDGVHSVFESGLLSIAGDNVQLKTNKKVYKGKVKDNGILFNNGLFVVED